MRWLPETRARPSSPTAPPCNSTRIPPVIGSIWPPPTRCWDDVSNQTWALEHAIQADPTTPDVAWEAANFYLVQGDNEKALREFHVVLENEPSMADLAIQFCWRISPDVDALLRDVVPRKVRGLCRVSRPADDQTGNGGNRQSVGSYDGFARRNPSNCATSTTISNTCSTTKMSIRPVWCGSKLLRASACLPTCPRRNNLIVNGDFSLDVLNGGFDWQYEKQQSVTLTLDPSDFHGGASFAADRL